MCWDLRENKERNRLNVCSSEGVMNVLFGFQCRIWQSHWGGAVCVQVESRTSTTKTDEKKKMERLQQTTRGRCVSPFSVFLFFFFRFASIRCPAKLCCLTKSVSKFCCLYLFSMVCGCLDIWITRFIWYTCGGVCGTWRLTKTSFSLSFSFSRGWCRVIMFLFVLDISVSFHIFCIDSCQLIALLVFFVEHIFFVLV